MMRDTDKTKEQLIAELAQMRQRITELEALEFKHKQVEEALRESEERLSGFMNSATDGFILFDSNFNCLEINKAALKITGLTKEEVVGKNITDVVPNIKETGRYDKYTEVIKTGNPFFVDDLVPHPKFGDINLALSAFKVGGGLGITIVDITERKQVEEALRESEEKYRQLVENLHEGVWVIDKEAYTSFVNPRMAEMLGYTVDEMLGKHLFSFMDQYGVEIATRSLERRKQGISEQHDFEFLHKDGTHVYMLLSTSPIIDEEGNYAGAVAGVQDITERRLMEEALQESEKKYCE